MGKLFLVTGMGHCGTKWLAWVLHRPVHGICAVHEGMKIWMGTGDGKNWRLGQFYLLVAGVDNYFDYYFSRIKELLVQYSVVVDCHSWLPDGINQIAGYLPKDSLAGIIYLVRDGIRQLDSLYALYQDPFWFRPIIDAQLEYAGIYSGDWTPWEYWCWWYAAGDHLAARLLHHSDVVILKLEDLTQNTIDLLGLAGWIHKPLLESFTMGQLKVGQQTVIHTHVAKNLHRTREEIWESWTPEMQQVFIRVCREEMELHGYYIPA